MAKKCKIFGPSVTVPGNKGYINQLIIIIFYFIWQPEYERYYVQIWFTRCLSVVVTALKQTKNFQSIKFA